MSHYLKTDAKKGEWGRGDYVQVADLNMANAIIAILEQHREKRSPCAFPNCYVTEPHQHHSSTTADAWYIDRPVAEMEFGDDASDRRSALRIIRAFVERVVSRNREYPARQEFGMHDELAAIEKETE